jgi:DNA-binding transcriptional LysR family regulator
MEELLPLLPTLVSLARTGSVSQSAVSLGVPRSTVSRRLARVEQVLGLKVAERTTHRFVLTAAGRRLVEGAVGALAQLETVREEVVATSGEVRGLLRVAMPAGVSGAFIGWFLAFLHARHPGIDVELTVTDRRVLRVEDGFDLVLVMGTPEPSAWLRRRLTEAELIAVASPDYLERAGTPGSIDALVGHLLLTSSSPGAAPSWPRLRGGSFPISPRLTTNDLSALREAALAGMGIALLPFHVVLSEVADGKLVRVLPTHVGETVDVFALYLPERRASPVLKAVLAAVAEFAELQTRARRG